MNRKNPYYLENRLSGCEKVKDQRELFYRKSTKGTIAAIEANNGTNRKVPAELNYLNLKLFQIFKEN